MVTNVDDFCEDYLEHHGILGMHWGVRRYQNPDGSLTQAGANRYKHKAARQTKRHLDMLRDKKYTDSVAIEKQKAYDEERKVLDSTDDKKKAMESLKQIKKDFKDRRKGFREEYKKQKLLDKETMNKMKNSEDKYGIYNSIKNRTMKELGARYKTTVNERRLYGMMENLTIAGCAASLASTGVGTALYLGYGVPLGSVIPWVLSSIGTTVGAVAATNAIYKKQKATL